MNPLEFQAARLGKFAHLASALWFGKSHLGTRSPVYVDIGARGGLPRTWRAAASRGLIRPVFFEPDPEEADRLAKAFPRAKVLPFALGSDDREVNLHLTREPGRSSLFKPDAAFLSQFDCSGWSVERLIPMRVTRMDAVWPGEFSEGPKYLKIDVQGFEMEILAGMGALLDGVLCVEHETVLRPLYVGQPRFNELYDYLADKGFDLVRLAPIGLYNDSILELNAYWVRRGTHADPLVRFWKKMNRVSDHQSMITLGH